MSFKSSVTASEFVAPLVTCGASGDDEVGGADGMIAPLLLTCETGVAAAAGAGEAGTSAGAGAAAADEAA
ncbi:MAG: hypothetical protein DHS20C04_24040 [Hyphococcus sp.]|nr:MAG: hypothetical protein DHS20C04_24040 [Marinicaulis sp.]